MSKQHVIFLLLLTFSIVQLKAQYAVVKKPKPSISFFETSLIACNVTANAGNDILICDDGFPVQLNGSYSGSIYNFDWSPSANLDNPGILNPQANAAGIYTLTVRSYDDANLIFNGDFEQGNTGFTSDYSTGNANWGNYLITEKGQKALCSKFIKSIQE